MTATFIDKNMITEDYVSYEVAKLLKEKGFDSECHSYYYPCHYPGGSIEYHRDKGAQSRTKIWYNVYSLKNLPKDHYLAPTLQMVMKWLREVHNISVEPLVDFGSGDTYWWSVDVAYIKKNGLIDELCGYNSYEEACDAAIKYCLENLI